jgi:hypothetical protein
MLPWHDVVHLSVAVLFLPLLSAPRIISASKTEPLVDRFAYSKTKTIKLTISCAKNYSTYAYCISIITLPHINLTLLTQHYEIMKELYSFDFFKSHHITNSWSWIGYSGK